MGRVLAKPVQYRRYGTSHKQLRNALLARWKPGDPCARCSQPMWDRDKIDLGHDHVNGGYTGLEHQACNRGEGSGRGNKGRQFTATAATVDVRCKTCGQPYHYAAKTCQICGRHYHPNAGTQKTCSRACGVTYRRLVSGTLGAQAATPCACGRPKSPRARRCRTCMLAIKAEASAQRQAAAALARMPVPAPCSECGTPCIKTTCSETCAAERDRRGARERMRRRWREHPDRVRAYKQRYRDKQAARTPQLAQARLW